MSQVPAEARTPPFSGRTAWARNVQTPLRKFLRTETGGAVVLLGAAVAALVWVNVDGSSYDSLWGTTLSIRIGGTGVSLDLREWVNSGLMTFFFFVLGLEARREFDLGELRERRRFALPLLAGIGGMAVAVAIYLLFNAGRSSAHGWGVTMSTDTAFALGLLALVGPRFPDRLRAFMLTVVVVDDILSLVVIALVYTNEVKVSALLVALGLFGVVLVVRALRIGIGLVYFALGAAIWVALLESGVDPIVVGLAMGLLAYAYPVARSDLERATERFREFREQPTPELARSVGIGLRSAVSPNERLQLLYHPWTSYLIVPLFALANAGIAIDGAFLKRAFTSPITLGIVVGYVIGKPVGIVGSAWLLTRLSRGRLRPPVGWAAVAGGGTIAGIGFTVALLVATLAFKGPQLDEAKLGILSAALGASLLTWLLFRATALLPRTPADSRAARHGRAARRSLRRRRPGARPHSWPASTRRSRWSSTATSSARTAGRPSRSCASSCVTSATSATSGGTCRSTTSIRNTQLAAEAAEAAADQGAFWEMHDLLFEHQDALRPSDLIELRRAAGARRRALHERSSGARRRRTCGRGRRQRRPQRRLRHADVLHQRPTPLRRLRHRHPVGGSARSRSAGDPDHQDQRLSAHRG